MPAFGAVSVSTSAILILPANPNRKSFIIVNTNTSVKLYIGPDSSVLTTSGIEIGAGASIAEDFNGNNQIYTGPVFGVAASAVDVRFWERTT